MVVMDWKSTKGMVINVANIGFDMAVNECKSANAIKNSIVTYKTELLLTKSMKLNVHSI